MYNSCGVFNPILGGEKFGHAIRFFCDNSARRKILPLTRFDFYQLPILGATSRSEPPFLVCPPNSLAAGAALLQGANSNIIIKDYLLSSLGFLTVLAIVALVIAVGVGVFLWNSESRDTGKLPVLSSRECKLLQYLDSKVPL